MDKQAILVAQIAEGVQAKLAPEIAKLSEDIAKLMVSVGASNARLLTLEHAVSNGAAGAKRTVRTGGGKAAGGKGKAVAGKGKNGGSDASKVTNALLYFRYAMGNDLNEYRGRFGTPENVEEAEKDQTVSKRDQEKDPVGYWSAVGNALWKNVISDEEKEGVRVDFANWKEESARDESEEQLAEETSP